MRSPRAGLDALDGAAHRLLYELQMEGLATGLDVHVEVRGSQPPCGAFLPRVFPGLLLRTDKGLVQRRCTESGMTPSSRA